MYICEYICMCLLSVISIGIGLEKQEVIDIGIGLKKSISCIPTLNDGQALVVWQVGSEYRVT